VDLQASRLTPLAEAPKLHPTYRAWLDQAEVERWNAATPLGDLIEVEDVVLIAGSSPGVAAYIVNEPLPAHTIVVDDDRQHDELLRLNFDDRRGVTVLTHDPVILLDRLLERFKPSILLLDLDCRLWRPEVIATLALPLPFLRALAVNYGHRATPERLERTLGLDTMLQTWHDEVDEDEDPLRWRRKPGTLDGWAIYTR